MNFSEQKKKRKRKAILIKLLSVSIFVLLSLTFFTLVFLRASQSNYLLEVNLGGGESLVTEQLPPILGDDDRPPLIVSPPPEPPTVSYRDNGNGTTTPPPLPIPPALVCSTPYEFVQFEGLVYFSIIFEIESLRGTLFYTNLLVSGYIEFSFVVSGTANLNANYGEINFSILVNQDSVTISGDILSRIGYTSIFSPDSFSLFLIVIN